MLKSLRRCASSCCRPVAQHWSTLRTARGASVVQPTEVSNREGVAEIIIKDQLHDILFISIKASMRPQRAIADKLAHILETRCRGEA
ncbi:unnamed protein product, partial [Trichogramma brassicae]